MALRTERTNKYDNEINTMKPSFFVDFVLFTNNFKYSAWVWLMSVQLVNSTSSFLINIVFAFSFQLYTSDSHTKEMFELWLNRSFMCLTVQRSTSDLMNQWIWMCVHSCMLLWKSYKICNNTISKTTHNQIYEQSDKQSIAQWI